MSLARAAIGLAALSLILLGGSNAWTDSCVISGPHYGLHADTVVWTMTLGSGGDCRRDFRLNKALAVTPRADVRDVKLLTPPQGGRVTLQSTGFVYAANSGFSGSDSFTLAVAGSIGDFQGASTIQINVTVVGQGPAAVRPPSRALLKPAPEFPLSPSPTVSALLHSQNREEALNNSGGLEWKPLKIGGGGFITGISIAPDGVKAIRTDTYGAYIWNADQRVWQQVVTTQSMPPGSWNLNNAGGVYEIVVCPSLTTRLYMMFDGNVFRSDDTGHSWHSTAFQSIAGVNPNDNNTRTFGRFMAVDPANADILYVGTPSNGLFVTGDGGTSFARVNSIPPALPPGPPLHKISTNLEARAGKQTIPLDAKSSKDFYLGQQLHLYESGNPSRSLQGAVVGFNETSIALQVNAVFGSGTAISWDLFGSQGGGDLIAFDASSRVAGGATQGIYVSVYGSGVFHSEDGGRSWELTKDSPSSHQHMVVDQSGDVYLTDNSNNSENLHKYSGKTWRTLGSVNAHSIAVDPASVNHVVAANSQRISISDDGGLSFRTISAMTREATDVPWLAKTNEDFMSNGDQAFDPSQPERLYFAEGIGVWYGVPDQHKSVMNWISQTSGIEQMVANVVLAPPGGHSIALSWDRPLFKIDDPDRYPATALPSYNKYAIVGGWSGDYVASKPPIIVAVMNAYGNDESGVSSDGGATWSPFPTLPPDIIKNGNIGGCIAAASATNIVWAPGGSPHTFFTLDGGGTWRISNGVGPLCGAYFIDTQVLAADRVNANTFYAYLSGGRGFYKSTDGGANFSLVYGGTIAPNDGYAMTLKTVPGRAGHLFYTSGFQQGAEHPVNTAFMRSVDGGSTWKTVSPLREVTAFGFGAPFPGHDYPSIYAAGWNGGTYGIWQSVDDAVTWTQIGPYPIGKFDPITSLDGDKVVPGMVYAAHKGSGYSYRPR